MNELSQEGLKSAESPTHAHPVTVRVNGKHVNLLKDIVTGIEIKREAIAQGVSIELSFQLQLERPGGGFDVIGDNDVVHVHENARFTAIAPDDHS
jgi:Multiubiquitin